MVYLGIAVAILVAASVIAFSLGSNDDTSTKSGTPIGSSPTPTKSTSAKPSSQSKTLAAFGGQGDKTTTTFSAAANWELRWQTKADPQFTVKLLDEDGMSRGQIVTAKQKTQGSVYVSEAGEFKLKVTAARDWSIRIVGKPAG